MEKTLLHLLCAFIFLFCFAVEAQEPSGTETVVAFEKQNVVATSIPNIQESLRMLENAMQASTEATDRPVREIVIQLFKQDLESERFLFFESEMKKLRKKYPEAPLRYLLTDRDSLEQKLDTKEFRDIEQEARQSRPLFNSRPTAIDWYATGIIGTAQASMWFMFSGEPLSMAAQIFLVVVANNILKSGIKLEANIMNLLNTPERHRLIREGHEPTSKKIQEIGLLKSAAVAGVFNLTVITATKVMQNYPFESLYSYEALLDATLTTALDWKIGLYTGLALWSSSLWSVALNKMKASTEDVSKRRTYDIVYQLMRGFRAVAMVAMLMDPNKLFEADSPLKQVPRIVGGVTIALVGVAALDMIYKQYLPRGWAYVKRQVSALNPFTSGDSLAHPLEEAFSSIVRVSECRIAISRFL